MRIALIVLVFCTNTIYSQTIEDIYVTILKNHLKSIEASDANFDDRREIVYLLENKNVNRIPEKVFIHGEYIKIEIVTPKKVKRNNIERILVFNSIDFKNQTFQVDIVDFLVEKKSTRKKLKLINIGGTKCKFNYDCENNSYNLDCEYLSI